LQDILERLAGEAAPHPPFGHLLLEIRRREADEVF
jgi:hypothetical protein